MNYWAPNSQRADYICIYCGNSPKTNFDETVHAADCDGVAFLAQLEGRPSIAGCMESIAEHVMES